MSRLSDLERAALTSLPDAWALTPACFEPNPVLVKLVGDKLAKTKRERPAPGAPFRFFVKRTSLGRMALGLPAMPNGEGADA